jgi:PAS domain S-box-containing protein
LSPAINSEKSSDAERIRRLKKLYALSMTLSGDPLEIFKGVAQTIGEIFGVATVCLSEIREGELRFLSVYENGIVTVNAGTCPLSVTPCATVVQSKDLRIYDRVAERFPQASFLRDQNAFSYCGFPSLDSEGNVVAVTCLVDSQPHEFSNEDQELLRIFGQRIAMEIERQRLLDEHRRVDSELRKLYRAIEQSPCAVMITDTDGIIEFVSPKFYEMTGYAPDEIIGRTPAVLKSGMTPAEKYRDLWDCLKSGREWRGEFLNRKKNGELFWARESISPIRDARGQVTHYLAIEEDNTERQRIEDRLREVQKMQAVGQLAGGIAHDFNNLLMVTVGNLELLADRIGEDDRPLADAALRASLRAAESTRKLLAISRRQPLDPEVIDAGGLVTGLVEMLRGTVGETIELKTVIPPDLWPAYADPVQVEAALLNLAINARDAMPQGGTITIELANVHFDDNESVVRGNGQSGDYLMFAVADTGVGMPPEVANRAFEPFFTTKETGKGTGLGLSAVYGFAWQSGGFAELKTALGRGTIVRIYLPRTITAADAPAGTEDERMAQTTT